MADVDGPAGSAHPEHEPWLYSGEVPSRPLLRYDGGQAGSVTVRAGAVTGEYRRPSGSCRVAAGVRVDPDGRTCLMAVATGLGSESGGDAAQRAVESVTGFRAGLSLEAATSSRALRRAARDCVAQVEHDLRRMREVRRSGLEFGTGLLLALFPLAVPAGGSIPFAAVRVGRASVWKVRAGAVDEIDFSAADGTREQRAARILPSHPTSPEPTTSEDTDNWIRDGEVLALVTGGVGRDDRDEVEGFLGPCWAGPPRSVDFLHRLGGPRGRDRAAAVAWIGHHDIPGIRGTADPGREDRAC